MECDFCGKKKAVFHIQTKVDGVFRTINICAECAASRGIETNGDKLELSLAGIMRALNSKKERNIVKTRCENCGKDVSEIIKSGLAGCPDCYNVFHKQVLNYLEENTGYVMHKGRLPENMAKLKELLTNKKKLELDLLEAVTKEDYEKAAIIRDEIFAMEPSLKSIKESFKNDE